MANIPENTTNPILRPVTRLETSTRVFGGEYIPGDEDQRGISNLQAIELAERDQYILSRVGQPYVPESGDIPAEVGIAPLDENGKVPKAQNTSGVVFTDDTQTLKNKTLKTDDGDSFYAGTASRALITDSNKKIVVSDTTSTELGYVHGVTSNIQTQLNGKVTPTSTNTLTNKTIDADSNNLLNTVTYKNISNVITEIPQDITLTLSSGTLTLKSGSKVYIPNGKSGDTPQFTTYTITRDWTLATSTEGVHFVCAANNGGIASRLVSNCVSGAGVTTTYGFAYNVTTNFIHSWSTTEGSDAMSFPICIVTVSGGAITSIDQVFNGMGYIGKHVFVLPGVKGLSPNGRNADGSLKSNTINYSTVKTVTATASGTHILGLDGDIYDVSISTWVYKEDTNLWDYYNDPTRHSTHCVAATYTVTSGVISNFKPNTVFHAVDWNDVMKGSGIERTPTLTTATNGGTVKYIVQQGVCYVVVDALKMQATGNAQAVCAVPNKKFSITVLGVPALAPNGTGLRGAFYVRDSTLYYDCQNVSSSYASFSYPVADDWVEN